MIPKEVVEFSFKKPRKPKKDYEQNRERKIHVVVSGSNNREIDRQCREIASKYDTKKEYFEEGYVYEQPYAS